MEFWDLFVTFSVADINRPRGPPCCKNCKWIFRQICVCFYFGCPGLADFHLPGVVLGVLFALFSTYLVFDCPGCSLLRLGAALSNLQAATFGAWAICNSATARSILSVRSTGFVLATIPSETLAHGLMYIFLCLRISLRYAVLHFFTYITSGASGNFYRAKLWRH